MAGSSQEVSRGRGRPWSGPGCTCAAIADYYMNQKQWDKAWPYAEAAGQTGAAFAMICAENAPKAAKNGPKPKSGPAQPASVIRTRPGIDGTPCAGEPEPAMSKPRLAFTEEWINANAQTASPDMLVRISAFYLSSGQLQKALPILRQTYQASPSTAGCAAAWLVADLLDERATRDEFCRFMETRHKADNPRFAMVWRLLREAVDRDGGGSLDLKAVASVQEQIPRRNQWITDFIIGMFLEKRGKPAEAREFLQKALENPLASGWMVPVARDTIRKIDENAKKGKADAKTGAA